MSIGTGIFLFVVGAILTFALEVRLDWIDLDLVGYILMAAGVLIFLIGIILLITRRSRARGATTTTVVDDDRV
jgi:nitrate reductase gamma subunit